MIRRTARLAGQIVLLFRRLAVDVLRFARPSFRSPVPVDPARNAVLLVKHLISSLEQLCEELLGYFIHDLRRFFFRPRARKRNSAEDVRENSGHAETFARIYAEKLLKHAGSVETESYPMPRLPEKIPVTVVLIGGLHGDIFHNKIWSRSHEYCNEKLGARCLLIAPNGRGGVIENAEHEILPALRAEADRELAAGRIVKFVLLGYSKGGLDSLQLVKSHPEFAKKHIAALVTVASPLRGAKSSRRMTVPLSRHLAEPMASDARPDVHARKGVSELDPDQWSMEGFWKDFSPPPEVRFASLSFECSLARAHFLLFLSHLLSEGPTDGVVEISESKFPTGFPAIDLGVIRANHLIALPDNEMQDDRPIVEAVLTMLGRLGAF